MSGYRSLHRENTASGGGGTGGAVWCVHMTPLLLSKKVVVRQQQQQQHTAVATDYRLWSVHGDGLVRSYRMMERRAGGGGSAVEEQNNPLDASALKMECTHVLYGKSQQQSSDSSSSSLSLGCTKLSTVHYGSGATAAMALLSLDLSGMIRIWSFPEGFDDKLVMEQQPQIQQPRSVKALAEFSVPNATGTSAVLCPTDDGDTDDLVAAVGCLDGSIAIVATGLPVQQSSSLPPPSPKSGGAGKSNKLDESWTPGHVLEHIGGSSDRRRASAVPLCLCWCPVSNRDAKTGERRGRVLVAGRQDGVIDLFLLNVCSKSYRRSQNNNRGGGEVYSCLQFHQRLSRHGLSPVRAVAFTHDGNLMMAGCDQALITVWDTSRGQQQQQQQNNSDEDVDDDMVFHRANNRPLAVLVHHVLNAHASWILSATAVAGGQDARRFITSSADCTLRVWDVGRGLHQPVHTFQTDHIVWTLDAVSSSKGSSNSNSSTAIQQQQQHQQQSLPPRLVTGSDNGWVQVFSLER